MLSEKQREGFKSEANGKTASQTASGLLAVYDPDRIEDEARALYGIPADRQPGFRRDERINCPFWLVLFAPCEELATPKV